MSLGVASLLSLIPSVLAYANTFTAPDLYGVFVESVFGGFWLSIGGLAFVMFIIMALIGGLSMWTTLTYLVFFLLAMSIGYGFGILSVVLWTILMAWSVIQYSRFINQYSGM